MKNILSLLVISLALMFNLAVSAKTQRVSSTDSQQAETGGMEQKIVDINSATVAELETIKGLGQKKAEAIIAYRESNGKFSSVEDLQQVRGIGKHYVERLIKENPGRLTAKAKSKA